MEDRPITLALSWASLVIDSLKLVPFMEDDMLSQGLVVLHVSILLLFLFCSHCLIFLS